MQEKIMIEVGGHLVSDELAKENFICHLDKCKGACCIEGDAGAPLLASEVQILEDIYPAVKPYMTAKGIETVEKFGTSVKDLDDDLTTPCVDGNKECAYVIWENGITKCAIEKAYEEGKTDYKKPISCHLYPIRLTAYPKFDMLHYDRWSICSAACSYGDEHQVKVYQFLKAPLIRKYGEAWYKELEENVKALNQA